MTRQQPAVPEAPIPGGLLFVAIGHFFFAAAFLVVTAVFATFGYTAEPASAAQGFRIGMVLFLAAALLHLAGGFGTLQRTNWSKGVSIAAASLVLLAFPLGTAFGVAAITIQVQTPPSE